jgi:hypothetical protein
MCLTRFGVAFRLSCIQLKSRRPAVKTPLIISDPKAAWAFRRLKLATATLLAMIKSSIKALIAADAFAVPRILTK